MRSTMTCLAAVAIAIRPEAHWRSMVWAATVTGQPARSATCAADVAGLHALGQDAAPDDIVDFAGSIPARSIAARIDKAPRVAPAVALNAPR